MDRNLHPCIICYDEYNVLKDFDHPEKKCKCAVKCCNICYQEYQKNYVCIICGVKTDAVDDIDEIDEKYLRYETKIDRLFDKALGHTFEGYSGIFLFPFGILLVVIFVIPRKLYDSSDSTGYRKHIVCISAILCYYFAALAIFFHNFISCFIPQFLIYLISSLVVLFYNVRYTVH